MLTVEPTQQAKGLGKIILSHIEIVAKERNLRRMRMTVIPVRTSLIEFYERRGFAATGLIEPFPAMDPRFGVPKVEGLCLKEFIKLLWSFLEIQKKFVGIQRKFWQFKETKVFLWRLTLVQVLIEFKLYRIRAVMMIMLMVIFHRSLTNIYIYMEIPKPALFDKWMEYISKP